MADKDKPVVDEIRNVLSRASKGKGPAPHYITTYQVIARLPEAMRAELINEHGKVGAGAGDWTSAATHVAHLLQRMADVEGDYFDARRVKFCLTESDEPRAGNDVIGLWRLKREA